jgi:hypothetical protein
LSAPGLVVTVVVTALVVPEDFVWVPACPDDPGPAFERMFTVVFRLLMIELFTCASGAVLSGVCGNTEVQPGLEGVEAHCANVGNTALQPANVGVAVHCTRDGRTVAHPAGEGVEVH